MGQTALHIIIVPGPVVKERAVCLTETMQVEEGEAEQTDYALEFRNVSFSYNGVEPNLKDVSFALKKGQTLGDPSRQRSPPVMERQAGRCWAAPPQYTMGATQGARR